MIDIKRSAYIKGRVARVDAIAAVAPTPDDLRLLNDVFRPFVAYVAECRYDAVPIDTTTDAVVNLVSGMVMELVVNTQPVGTSENQVNTVAQTIIDELAESLTNALSQVYGQKPTAN